MRKPTALITSLLTFVSPLALAHPGHVGHMDMLSGLAHPLSGLDHMSVMVAVGVFAAMFGGRARWQMPAAFVSFMLLGAMAGVMGMHMPGMEMAIIASVIGMGVMLMSGSRLSRHWAMSMIMLFAAFHGLAHGQEMPANAQVLQYFLGFTLSTIGLHACGMALGHGLLRVKVTKKAQSVLGIMMALLGSVLLFS